MVKGHVKKTQGPRDLPSHTTGRTDTPPGVPLPSRNDDPAYWARSYAQRDANPTIGTADKHPPRTQTTQRNNVCIAYHECSDSLSPACYHIRPHHPSPQIGVSSTTLRARSFPPRTTPPPTTTRSPQSQGCVPPHLPILRVPPSGSETDGTAPRILMHDIDNPFQTHPDLSGPHLSPATHTGPTTHTTSQFLNLGYSLPPHEGELALGIAHVDCCSGHSFSGVVNVMGSAPVHASRVNGRQPRQGTCQEVIYMMTCIPLSHRRT